MTQQGTYGVHQLPYAGEKSYAHVLVPFNVRMTQLPPMDKRQLAFSSEAGHNNKSCSLWLE